jgi:rubrerythrin
MPTLGQVLHAGFLKVCKTCGAVNNHPFKCPHCEERAAKERAQKTVTKKA